LSCVLWLFEAKIATVSFGIPHHVTRHVTLVVHFVVVCLCVIFQCLLLVQIAWCSFQFQDILAMPISIYLVLTYAT
jgi:hypothetical protein